MNRFQFLHLWSCAVGMMDAGTGLALILAPAFILKIMGVPALHPETLPFISWMGVFIAAVGLSYGWVFRGRREAETVWSFTALVRLSVAMFVAWKISSGELSKSWALVAVTDGVVAIGQLLILRAGWWKGKS